MDIVSIIKTAFLIVVLFCALIGAFGPQLKYRSIDAQVYLYKSVHSGTTRYFKDYSLGCKAIDNTVDASFAFAILSWVTILVGLAISAISIFKKDLIPSLVNVIVAAFAWVFLGITWPLTVAVYYSKYCGSSTSLHASTKPYYGFGFIVVAFILTTMWLVFEVLSLLKLIPVGTSTEGGSTTAQEEEKPTNNAPV